MSEGRPVLSGLPRLDMPVPAGVRAAAGGRSLRPVWVNEADGLTFEAAGETGRCFIKWAPRGSEPDLKAEADRMSWAAEFHAVPRPLELGSDEDGTWLVTAALPGDSAVADKWKDDPATAVAAIGEGLRALHDALPVDRCPFTWSAADRVADTREQAARGRLDPALWHEVHRSLSIDEALDAAAETPPPDRLVVAHGDACAPNTLIRVDGRWSGHVDLGLLGIADRWADLAVATWSAEWNYGPGWEDRLLGAYGVRADPERTRYYRLLWDLSS
jgi:kanamycin kinase